MTAIAEHILLPDGERPRQARLPSADSERFRPLRCGLINLYRYDYQEFVFEQGRLLLRGNNGTGKSRVLALTLPFLLDGEVGSHRLEPDGDKARRIEWNLLLGGRYSDRVGYSFLEFGRQGQDGAEYVTLGCGLHAVSGGGLVGKWFFVTKQRIGRELFLTARGGYPIGRERLAESIGGHGQVFTSANKYRERVDQELFQLGPQRYEALLGLLIQLRKPQLSRQLDEKALSQALSEALAPLPEGVLDTVADAFHGLERDREELADYQGAQEAVQEFLYHYERYAKTVTRRRAALVRSTHAAYEDAQRKLREAERQRDAAESRLGELRAEQQELERKEQVCEAEIEVLSSRPELADGERIESERRRAAQLARTAEQARSDIQKAQASVETLSAQHRKADESAKGAAASAKRRALEAAERAESAGFLALHGQHAAELAPVNDGDAAARRAERGLREAIEQKLRGIAEVQKKGEALRRAQSELDRARQVLQGRQEELDRRRSDEAEARDVLLVQRDLLARSYRSFSTEARELRLEDAEEIVGALVGWVDAGEGPTPVAEAVRAAAEEAIARLSAAARSAEFLVHEAQQQRDELTAERRRVADARHLPPPVPPTRSAEARSERAGAPLWALCDFRAEVPEGVRAQVEAGLEASGLLDAWVCPDGALLPAGTQDTALTLIRAAGLRAPRARHLGQLLIPAVDQQSRQAAAVSDEVVAALLGQIGLGEPSVEAEAAVWVGEDGSFRLGPLAGQWQKPAAQHIGDGAREQSRRQRLRELDERIERAEELLARRQAEQEQVRERQKLAQREIRGAPDDRALVTAVQGLMRARAETWRADERFAEAEAKTLECQRICGARQGERDALACELDLTAWLERLDELRDALGQYREALGRSLAALQLYFAQQKQVLCLAALLDAACADAESRRLRALEAATEAAAAQGAYELLERTVGVEVRRVREELDAARALHASIRKQKKEADQEHGQRLASRARAESEVEQYATAMRQQAEARGHAIEQVKTLAVQQVLALVAPRIHVPAGEEWSVTSAVELCRGLEQQLDGVDASDDEWQRRRNDIYSRAKKAEEALSRHGQKTDLSEVDEVFIVSGQLGERLVPITELQAFFADQVESRQALLSQREREVLENHLLSEVAHELHDRIQQAEALVAEMNRELVARPTTMGIKLRFVWGLGESAPQGLAEVRRLLLRAVGVWSPAERRIVADFLQQQIKRARAEDPVGTWLEHLGSAFDYRAWHQFVIELHQDGLWQRLTRKSFGTGSGGEKAVSLTLPQFAAAAAHYRSAWARAPRLILLDEVFVGIDREMRSKCMALLRDFDLDFVMTSENEWGCYATLPGVAICHMTARAGIDAVAVSRWVWTGRERRRAEFVAPPLSEPDEQPEPGSAHGEKGAA